MTDALAHSIIDGRRGWWQRTCHSKDANCTSVRHAPIRRTFHDPLACCFAIRHFLLCLNIGCTSYTVQGSLVSESRWYSHKSQASCSQIAIPNLSISSTIEYSDESRQFERTVWKCKGCSLRYRESWREILAHPPTAISGGQANNSRTAACKSL